MVAIPSIFSIVLEFRRRRRIQVRPLTRGFLERRPFSPLADLLVVPAQQNFGHAPAAKFRRTRILRAVQHARIALEGLEHCRVRIPQHSRDEPRDDVDYHRRRQFTAAQNVIAHGQLFIRQMLRHPLIHAFIAATDQQQFRHVAEPARRRLVELSSLRRKQNHPLPRVPFAARALGKNRLHRVEQRLRLQQHPLAAAERPVIHCLMPVMRPVPQIVNADLELPLFEPPCRHSMLERPAKKLGENREHMKLHGRFKSFKPCGKFTKIRFACVSISTQIARANGINSSPPTSNSPLPPASSQPVTAPTSSPVTLSRTSHPIRSARKCSSGSSSTRSASGMRTSQRSSSSASEIVSTPRNLKIHSLRCCRTDSTSIPPVPTGAPSRNRKTSRSC